MLDSVFVQVGPMEARLFDFNAESRTQDAHLTWSTQQAYNVSHFIVEHSLDGMDYETLGMVKAGEDSESQQDYDFIHQKPLQGLHYYRLRLVDPNGRYDFSPVRILRFGEEAQGLYTVYPNPGDGRFNFEFMLKDKADIQLHILNLNGQSLRQLDLGRGQAGRYVQQVALGELAPGIYVYRLSINGKSYLGKLTIEP